MLSNNHSIILFDGVCNFCNSIVNFIIAKDKKDKFRFAPQQSEAGKKISEQYNINATSQDTFYLIEEGKVYSHSTGVLRILKQFPWYLSWIYIFIVIPRLIRDPIYNLFAKHRYKLFGKQVNCMIPTQEVKDKFLV